MELWDIRDETGKKTGRIIERGQPILDGEYVLGVFILIKLTDGNYLIQKRSKTKKLFPGRWDLTGGAVQSGEDSKTAAIREAREELGVTLDPAGMTLIGTYKKRNMLVDLWLAETEINLSDCMINQREVEEIAIVGPDALIKMVFDKGRLEDEYKNMIENYIFN